ncbi:hypothetical protein M1432_01105 [Patescibacteria group bacterium]|nr:hypothetical protein [Patescibacteria group bacterium]
MKGKLTALGLAVLIAAGIWLPGTGRAQVVTNGSATASGTSDAEINRIMMQGLNKIIQELQAMIVQRMQQVGQNPAVSSSATAVSAAPAVAPSAVSSSAPVKIAVPSMTVMFSPYCIGSAVDVVAAPLGNPGGTGPFEKLGLATSTEPGIARYRIQWFDGSWSPWYVPGVNDVDQLDNIDGTQRRIWSYFDDHTHEYIYCQTQTR